MVPAALMAWLAVLVLVQHSSRLALAVAVVAVLVVVGVWSRYPLVAACAIALAVSSLSVSWRLAVVETSPLRAWAEVGSVVTVEATLRDDSRLLASGSMLWSLTVHQASRSGESVTMRVRAVAFVSAEGPPPAAGQPVRLRARLTPSQRSDVAATLHVSTWENSVAPQWWWTAAEGLRRSIRHATDRHGDAPAALLPALVTGDESGLDALVRDDFERAGLTHLLAVSGANLTIVLGLVLWLLRLAGGRRLLVPVGLLVVVAFVLVARPEPSVQRAAVMGVVALLALGRVTSTSGLRALSWAVVALVTIDPWLGSQAGFVLSVCATAGILLLGPPLAARFERWAPRPVALALAVPLAAQLACLPVAAALSGSVSVVSWVTNILAGVAVAPATVCGLIAGLLYLIWEPLAWPFAELGWLATSWIVAVGRYAAAAPGATVDWSRSAWLLVPFVLGLVAVVVKWGHRRIFVAALCLVMGAALWRPFERAWLPSEAAVVACDVGQGDAFVVPVGAGAGIVVDVGEQPALIDRCLRGLGIDTVPLAILSHSDADHVGGWSGLARGRKIGTVLVGPSSAPGVTGLLEAAAGDSFTVAGIQIDVLWPRDAETSGDANDESLVVRIDTGTARLLFTGDLSERTQRRLAFEDVEADLLKMPHHGSADFWPGLLDVVSPSVAMIGVGAENRHGHPADSVLAAVAERGIPVARTDLDGTFALVPEPGGWQVVRR